MLDVLAVHRLARLVTADTITAPPRDALIRAAYEKDGQGETADAERAETGASWTKFAQDDEGAPRAAAGLVCRWCVSIHCALAVVALRRLAPRAWAPVATALALSSASTLLAALED